MPGGSNSLRRSLSHSEGDASDDNVNDEMRPRAQARYHELLKSDTQLQVTHGVVLGKTCKHCMRRYRCQRRRGSICCSFQYAIGRVGHPEPKCCHKACAYDGEKVAWLSQNCGTVIEMMAGICKTYSERTAFAYCPAGSVDWHTVTYKDYWARVQALAGGEPLQPLITPCMLYGSIS